MLHRSWGILFGLALIALSALLYGVHYAIFHDAHHIFIYLMGDIAFLPLEVLIVTLILHRVLSIREKQSLLNKMNMVIGTFFSEVGTPLIGYLSQLDTNSAELRDLLRLHPEWSSRDFRQLRKTLQKREFSVACQAAVLQDLKSFLSGKRSFLLRLLANPNLLEHDAFTSLLWAVFHLTDELGHRDDLEKLPAKDYEHLSVDIRRAYGQLLLEWVSYMDHLRKTYPYLYSLATRTNPFDEQKSVVFSD